jgi:hypothetical protein
MWARALVLAALALAGCGEKTEPAGPSAVTGTVDLERPSAPANPDAGTQAGHRVPDAAATTRGASFAFTGRVRPPAARVELTPPRGRAAVVKQGGDGEFRAEARKLRRGANRYVLRGTAPGLEPWSVDISITRR